MTATRAFLVALVGAVLLGSSIAYSEVDADFSRIPSVKPVITNVDLDDKARLWVRRTIAGPGTAFDVFEPNGKLVAPVRSPLRISEYWHPTIRGAFLSPVVQDADDVPFVVRARIVPASAAR